MVSVMALRQVNDVQDRPIEEHGARVSAEALTEADREAWDRSKR
ncbi:hypothetical protein BSLA_02r0503 [Burkholderia stabilis]|nr:hypothetical protein BSLA_02r0503 [Burkholderia stabilis]